MNVYPKEGALLVVSILHSIADSERVMWCGVTVSQTISVEAYKAAKKS